MSRQQCRSVLGRVPAFSLKWYPQVPCHFSHSTTADRLLSREEQEGPTRRRALALLPPHTCRLTQSREYSG